jgi:integrase
VTTITIDHNKQVVRDLIAKDTNSGFKPKTLALDRSALKAFVGNSTKKIEEITDNKWHEFLNSYADTPNTHNAFLNVLRKTRKMLGMPKLDHKSRRVKPNPKINLNVMDAEYEKLERACTSDRDRVLLAILRYGGLRANEITGLTVNSFDVHGDSITVRFYREKTNVQAEVELVEPAPLIEKFLRGKEPKSALFFGRGGPITYMGIYHAIERLCDKAGVKFHPHLFRHYRATELGKNNFTKWDLDNMFGWSGSSNTASVYVNLSNDETRNKVKKLGGAKVDEDVRVVYRCKRCETIVPKESDFCPRCGMSKSTGDALMAAKKPANDVLDMMSPDVKAKLISDLTAEIIKKMKS